MLLFILCLQQSYWESFEGKEWTSQFWFAYNSLGCKNLIIIFMSTEIARKIIEQVRAGQCKRNNCISQQRDPPDVVWFGKQYGSNKEVTCSACYICNDEAVKKSIPTQLNVLPLSLFIEQFVTELKQYDKLKNSNDFFPKVVREKGKDLLVELQKTEVEINENLVQLVAAIAGFCKKVEESNAKIFKHQVFEDIIAMNTDGKMQGLLDKISKLIEMLNCGVDDVYHFQDTEAQAKKIAKLKGLIVDLTQRTTETLKDLFDCLREKKELISKI